MNLLLSSFSLSILIFFISIFSTKEALALPLMNEFAILQGATSQTETQIAVLRYRESSLNYFYSSENNKKVKINTVITKSRVFSNWVIDHLYIKKLSSNSNYSLFIETVSGIRLDTREFSTLNLNKQSMKIAIASCMSDAFLLHQKRIWTNLVNEKPDLIFFVGDNVYASIQDPVTPDQIWNRYVQTRSLLEIFYSKKLIPIFATWDDHDFGQNDGDKTYKYVKDAKVIFEDFFPRDVIPGLLEKGEGVGQLLTLNNQNFIFMDDRTFRDKPQGKSMWGMNQEEWLKNVLLKSNNKEKNIFKNWIINGSQIFGKYGPSESLEKDFPQHFNRLNLLLKSIYTPTLFISGDIHASELIYISNDFFNQKTIEITSSSMHSIHHPKGSLLSNPRRLAGYDGDNFVLIEFDPQLNNSPLQIKSINSFNEVTFTSLFTIELL